MKSIKIRKSNKRKIDNRLLDNRVNAQLLAFDISSELRAVIVYDDRERSITVGK